MNCPYCREALEASGAGGVSCVSCRTPLHAECAALHGRCVIYGCGATDFVLSPPAPSGRQELRLLPSPAQRRRGRRRGPPSLAGRRTRAWLRALVGEAGEALGSDALAVGGALVGAAVSLWQVVG